MKSLSVELLKIISALISIIIYIVLGKFLGAQFLVIYTFTLTLLIISSSIFDRGMNIVNLDKNLIDYKFNNVNLPYSKSIAFFLLTSVFIYTYMNRFGSIFEYILLIFSLLISLPFSTYTMRWNTIFKREGNLNCQILFGEILPLSIRGILVIILSYLLGYYGFVLAIIIASMFTALFLKYKFPVENLYFISNFNCSNSKNDSHIFILSLIISIKNQILGLIIPLVKSEYQPSFVVISRVYGICVILLSGIYSRIPNTLRFIHTKNGKFKTYLYSFIIVTFSFLFTISSPLWLPVAAYIFSIKTEYDLYIALLVLLVGLGLLTSFFSLILQVLSKTKLSFSIEIFYIFILSFFSIYGVKIIG